MRVSIIGQAAFGESVLKRLVEDHFEIAGVSAPPPSGSRVDPLWAAAESLGVPLVATASLKGEGGETWRKIESDLCLMAFVTDILPESVFDDPKHGTIQYHPSLLPLHRGSSAINWAVINGETETGLTIFWPDRGIDTGPVLLQKSIAIGPDDTVGSLYFNKLFALGVDAMVESARMVEAGTAPKVEQDHTLGTYEPPCQDQHAEIRWYEPASRISALIRGCNPQPGAWTVHGGEKLRFFDCKLTGALAAGMPGRVFNVDGEGFDIRLNGGVLRVTRVQPAGGKKMSAGEWAASAGLATGFRFK